jgi:predicted type IV restriction endonuclease/GTPase SAR1 family protein
LDTDDVLQALRRVISESAARDLNEADTRHRVIDFILHDVLSWPRNRVNVEEYIKPGYADYVLKKANGDDLLFVEAKREGSYFHLPIPYNGDERSTFIGISKLLTDPAIRDAMHQVRTYCFDSGCEFAAITNGHEWIFFKTFEKGKKWETLQGFVIRTIQFFDAEYTRAVNALSYVAITENSSLPILLSSAPPKDRNVFYPKEKIPSYSHIISANRLAPVLRPVVNRYFGVIKDAESEFMERCYVSQREYHDAHDGMRTLIRDSLTPYFEEHGIQQLEDTGKGGRLGGRLTKNLKNRKSAEVLVLFGGKGSGKSTFIKRLLHHNPPRWLRENCLVAIVDLLPVVEDKETIRNAIWSTLVRELDPEGLLNGDRDTVIKALFSDTFDVAQRQALAGLSSKSEAYNVKLNDLFAKWKGDLHYACGRLVQHCGNSGKGVIIVIDNTDQYTAEVQDFCFTAAQEIAHSLNCVVLISMREERFFQSKIHGVLDAFQNAGFHISSPKPAEVFRKRLDYAVSVLSDPAKRQLLLGKPDAGYVGDTCSYLTILAREFINDSSPLNQFLTASGHGDIRLSLDLFRKFLISGYTNVDEMIAAGRWSFLLHQVIKPVMIPDRYYYDESRSEIPNVYQPRSMRHGSHFTALRILRKLGKSVDVFAPPWVSVAELKTYFVEVFNMLEDFELNVDMLLKRAFIESSNRLDFYSPSVDAVRITNYGVFMLNDLCHEFVYLDLACTDCGLYDQQTANYLSAAARDEYSRFNQGDRLGRVEIRLDRVDRFISYLHDEELRERDLYSLGMPLAETFTAVTRERFSTERQRVLESAKRQTQARRTRADGRPYSRNGQKPSWH